ncbi:type I-E CRISPR-associated protein Cas6/Cse3/CasE [Derxia gummosa]|uniref:Type I-E CRISPR-associated protein Cas6/Cse3/CasE n=1 Tax=Derxia gummosa DSM 723 TaxID=1121388 RepID=A0A8B6X7N3_9BURK|nr:type I-E CRISPR-associated protein Cas6/Cse3/CasE [Derxia gummosa]
MFFSLIKPAEGREREAARARLTGPYAEHQWLWRLFAAPEGTARDFLFRRRDVDGLPRYYVVSQRAPGRPDAGWTLDVRDYAPRVRVGDRLAFELRANPTVRHDRSGKSQRHDVVMEAKRALLAEHGAARWGEIPPSVRPELYELVAEAAGHWLDRRAERCGFALDREALAVEAYTQHGRDERGTAARGLAFSSVDFRGELVVTEPQAFVQTLAGGIGSARAFGCGLLLVRPVGY